MLEFQEGFFEPEIREDFFVDSTMKTVWAAGLEVLQTVAEICDKYGLTWYACFGTLLGAIRHEGYIPWDDDLDIVMLREDYMKLMKVLPQELPEGYWFRSPFSEDGYSQYHAFVVNSKRINMTPEFLKKYHNCPFAAGMDIFPLDYLPRNKNEWEIQKSLFTLATGVVLKTRDLKELKIEDDDGEQRKKAGIAEIKKTMRQLEKFCKVKLDYSAVKSEQWDTVISQAWELANQIAMLYGSQDSDHIVMYGDYFQWEKKYPKSCFQEVYSATFENFMLPIPNGYEEVLRNTYGDYQIRTKAPGMHDYPYYARQLRQMREYVNNLEERAEKVGLVAAREKQEPIFPKNWEKLPDGRKVVLFVNDIQLHAEFGEKALDMLEQTLSAFEDRRDEVLLWWRPQEQMKTLLGLLSQELVDRYDRVLKGYKDAGWGICDETYDEDRAAEHCDVYYGEMNYIARSIKDQKPIVIEKIDELMVGEIFKEHLK